MKSPARNGSLIEFAIESTSGADKDRRGRALQRLADEDPTLAVKIDPETGQAIIGGQSEQHLDTLNDRLRYEFGVKANIGAPLVVYRETLGQAGTVDHTHREPLDGTAGFARVLIEFAPGAAGSGFVFGSRISDAETPTDRIRAIGTGLRSVSENGLIAGFPVIDVKATLIEASSRGATSGTRAFEIAARAAFREARLHCAPILLEPIMTVKVTAPVRFIHLVKADLIARGGEILKQAGPDEAGQVCASVPLSKLIGYTKDIHRLADGCAEVALEFDRYAPILASDAPDDEPFPPAIGVRV